MVRVTAALADKIKHYPTKERSSVVSILKEFDKMTADEIIHMHEARRVANDNIYTYPVNNNGKLIFGVVENGASKELVLLDVVHDRDIYSYIRATS